MKTIEDMVDSYIEGDWGRGVGPYAPPAEDDDSTERANGELADWIEAAIDTLPCVSYSDARWYDRIYNLAQHIRAGRVGNPNDAFNEIEETR